jgi:dolichol-phosphate mannosyltransferase
MADLSDAPEDIYKYYLALKEGHECVFGSRFIRGSKVKDYPKNKYWLNRIANTFVKYLFWLDYNDCTNAFKAYRREVIEGIQPIISCHFNLTIELPLKAIVRGYQHKIIPISWTNRAVGKSNLVIQEMGSRYLFIVLYLWLEKKLAKGDYKRRMRTTPIIVDSTEDDRKVV